MSAEKGISVNPKTFKEQPLCELCFEDALRIGESRGGKLRAQEFKETSIRFCVDGLRDWLTTFADDRAGSSLYAVIRDGIWHWASFCETDPVLVTARKEFVRLRREIAEETSYTDVMERLKQPASILFGRASRRSINVALPMEAVGVVSRTGEALGIYFSKFVQVGLAWSLAHNRDRLYASWASEVFDPLFRSVMSWAAEKIADLGEVRAIIAYRYNTKRG